MESSIGPDAAALRGVVERAQRGLTDRESLVETLVLAAVAGEHVLVVGPPGTAKSEAVRRVATELGGSYFEYLLGRFTEPNEVFGPVDLRRLREGVVEIETAGMLPEAEVAFLDEVFLGSTAILNTLLGVLNERTFRRGSTVRSCPLRLCVGATNTLPDDVSLAAFADRFLVRVFVDPVPDPSLEEMLEAGWSLGRTAPPEPVGMGVLDRLAAARSSCDLDNVRPLIGAAVRRMRSAGIALSDRRAVRAQGLVAAAAVLEGRGVATGADLWPLPLVVPTSEAQPVAREALADLLAAAESRTLPHAAEELSAGPLARARRMVTASAGLLASADQDLGPDERLKAEAILREIDAGFAPDSLPDDLGEVRAQLVSLLQEG
ncbi:MAG: AAA domain-containing protein [Sulfitobacter sp.]|nr:AAA domain-containing protein [Sulfitobacter sp.]